MKTIAYWPAALVLTCSVIAIKLSSAHADGVNSAVFDVKLPAGYRNWPLISVAHEAGDLNDLRAVLGNDIAIKAFRAGTVPFPDGAIIARLAWKYVPSDENNRAFGREQSFVAGAPTNVQFMVKDAKKYSATGGWGFAQFDDGEAVDAARLVGCYACHAPSKAGDFVFTRYAP